MQKPEKDKGCGTHAKCYGCVVNTFMNYMELASTMYVCQESIEAHMKEGAEVIISECIRSDLDKIGETWGLMLDSPVWKEVSPRRRAGMRRGFDLLNVAAMSRV